jgi:4-diphosphocytidyl-2-C-methyl-D-erythritol kinase
MLRYGVLSKESVSPRRLVLNAAAKVNLVLEVLGKRDDGYHEIATVMHAVDLSDRVTLEASDVLDLRASDASIPLDRTNLAWRAATALGKAAGVDRGVRITLDKRIPVGAGLGGGSADAAAVLIGLTRLWQLDWSIEQLTDVAVELGMDVPFFLQGGAALATGRGERLAPVNGASLALVLVHPGFPVSTADAYRRVSPSVYSDGTHARQMTAALARRWPAAVAGRLYNALEAPVAAVHPEITRMRAALVAAGALGAMMSGSGGTVFGVARSLEHARQVQERVQRGSWACWAVRTLRGPAIRMKADTVRRTGKS